MRDARCELRDARCEMRDARCEMRDASCELKHRKKFETRKGTENTKDTESDGERIEFKRILRKLKFLKKRLDNKSVLLYIILNNITVVQIQLNFKLF